MQSSLEQAAGTLCDKGKIVVIEPGTGGTLIEAEERFGVGDGDERRQKDAAERVLDALEGWERGENIHFQTFFYFESRKDFLENLSTRNRQIPETISDGLGSFLNMHRQNGKIILYADRRMNVLTRSNHRIGYPDVFESPSVVSEKHIPPPMLGLGKLLGHILRALLVGLSTSLPIPTAH